MNMPDLKFDKNGLIPAIVQDDLNGEVLMLAYMNREAVEKTVESGFTHFWSRSRSKMWKKGETSGHVQEVKAMLYDCDKDAVLIKVIQHGAGACHTGHRSCFFTAFSGEKTAGKVFSETDVYGDK
jgi:phosphoribosyl-AMP cyclohydrolase